MNICRSRTSRGRGRDEGPQQRASGAAKGYSELPAEEETAHACTPRVSICITNIHRTCPSSFFLPSLDISIC